MHILKGRVKGKERNVMAPFRLELFNIYMLDPWKCSAYFLIQYPWIKQEYKFKIPPILKYSPQRLDICIDCIIYVLVFIHMD